MFTAGITSLGCPRNLIDSEVMIGSLKSAGFKIIDVEKNPEASPFFYTRLSARLDEKSERHTQSQWVRLAQPAFFSLLLVKFLLCKLL